MKKDNFLATDDWIDSKIFALLDQAKLLKQNRIGGSLEGKVLAMVFFDLSLRTKISFEVAMLKHGGHAVCIEPGKNSWPIETRKNVVMDGDTTEHVIEAAKVISRYCDAIGVRAFPRGKIWNDAKKDDILKSFAAYATVPVINLESARRHPCQGLADALTIKEKFDYNPKDKKFVLSWAWHPKPLPTAVPVSAAINAARLGMNVTIVHPPGFELDFDDLTVIHSYTIKNNTKLIISNNLKEAIEDAHVVYAKSWGNLNLFGNSEAEANFRAPLKMWKITQDLMHTTIPGQGIFMHCLPVRRNVVVSDTVLDHGPWSVVIDQAENRLHVQRALLLNLIGEFK